LLRIKSTLILFEIFFFININFSLFVSCYQKYSIRILLTSKPLNTPHRLSIQLFKNSYRSFFVDIPNSSCSILAATS
jgi:hypothetical protein